MKSRAENQVGTGQAAIDATTRPMRRHGAGAYLRQALGVAGAATAAVMFLWLPAGWLGLVPSMIDVYGPAGLRIPAGMAVGGLLLAAIGFNDF